MKSPLGSDKTVARSNVITVLLDNALSRQDIVVVCTGRKQKTLGFAVGISSDVDKFWSAIVRCSTVAALSRVRGEEERVTSGLRNVDGI